MPSIRVVLLCALTIVAPGSAVAQQWTSAPPQRLVISEEAIAAGLATPPAARSIQSDDSVVDGAVKGAIIGGLAMGIFAGYICYAMGEEGDPPCWADIVRIGVFGAGIGAAAGAGVDALAARNPAAHDRPVPPLAIGLRHAVRAR